MKLFLALVNLVCSLLGLKPKLSKQERQEAREYRQGEAQGAAEVRAEAAEKTLQAAKAALELETRMQEAQDAVASGSPPQEKPHAGTDLFHQD